MPLFTVIRSLKINNKPFRIFLREKTDAISHICCPKIILAAPRRVKGEKSPSFLNVRHFSASNNTIAAMMPKIDFFVAKKNDKRKFPLHMVFFI